MLLRELSSSLPSPLNLPVVRCHRDPLPLSPTPVSSTIIHAKRSARQQKSRAREMNGADHLRHWNQSRRLWKRETRAMLALLEQRRKDEVEHPTSMHPPLPASVAKLKHGGLSDAGSVSGASHSAHS